MVVKQRDAIKRAEIKPFEQHIKNEKGEDVIEIVFADHSCVTHLDFYIQDSVFLKSITEFDMSKWSEKHKNDNYRFNQKSILKTLKDLVEKELK